MRQGYRGAAAIAFTGALVLAACSSGQDNSDNSADTATSAVGGDKSTTTITEAEASYPRDDELRLNEIQVIGTHNSYHRRPNPDFAVQLEEMIPALAGVFDYEHRPLTEQLDDLGIRQFELDVFHDPEGTIFSDRKAHVVAGLPPDGGIEELHDPGFKVLHIQEVDVESTCWTFVMCLEEIKTWSDSNEWHVPIFVLVEMKSDVTPDVFDMGFVEPLPIDAAAMVALDEEIRSVFAEDDLITPDLVKGSSETLADAIAKDGWPTLGEVRGRVMFLLDNGGEVQEAYLQNHPLLEGAVLFTGAHEPGEPNAAFLKLNDPYETDAIRAAVQSGHIVRTRSDGDAHIGSTDPSEQRDTALASGAQFVSTDYPEPTLLSFPEYLVRFDHAPPEDTQEDVDSGAANPFTRCNPLIAPDWCTPLDVESRAVG